MSEKPQFDVFLCHNSTDKPEVEKVAYKLKELSLVPWLDKWELQPGRPWRRELEKQIGQVHSAAVFVGQNGQGPWQDMEIDTLLNEFAHRGCPVIPVLLRNAPNEPDLPLFLKGMGWVDFRQKQPNPIEQLFWGIKGQKLSDYFDYLQSKLIALLKKQDALTLEIEDVKRRLEAEEGLRSQPDPDLQLLLDWLSSIKEIRVKEYGDKTLKDFPNLKNEVIKENNLDRFYLEISCYLDFIRLSVERDNEIFIDEPALPPTLANSEIYESACPDIYTEFFSLVKDRIPKHIKPTVRDKLGANIDSFLKRLLFY